MEKLDQRYEWWVTTVSSEYMRSKKLVVHCQSFLEEDDDGRGSSWNAEILIDSSLYASASAKNLPSDELISDLIT